MVFFMLSGTIVATGNARAEEPKFAGPGNPQGSNKIMLMTDDRFWALIGTTTAFDSYPLCVPLSENCQLTISKPTKPPLMSR